MVISNNILSFLNDLSKNNNRDWFQANKIRYETARNEFEIITTELINRLSVHNRALVGLTAKSSIFRIYRDTRFSHNKTPYKNNMGAYMVPGGKNAWKAGYYFHLEPGNCMLAGGIYMPPAEVLKALRTEIYNFTDEFKEIINQSVFKETFGKIDDEKLKTPPKGFPKDFEDIDLLKFKSYTVVKIIPDNKITAPDFIDYSIDIFKKMMPLNEFLNRAVRENK
jgi:uncharacterized protein (TIGR02453 family)